MRTIHRDIVGAFIFSSDGKLLLGKNYKGGVYKDMWVIPGGGIDPGETKLDALRREVLEEVALDVNEGIVEVIDIELTGESEKTLRETNETVLVKMSFSNYKIAMPHEASLLRPEAGDDFTSPHWFTKEEAATLNLSPPSIRSLNHIGFLTA